MLSSILQLKWTLFTLRDSLLEYFAHRDYVKNASLQALDLFLGMFILALTILST